MKLSDAIRLGSMLGPQAYGHLTRRRRKYFVFGPVVNEYCALGAAFVASGARTVQKTHHDNGASGGFRGAMGAHKVGETYNVVEHEWADFMWVSISCPLCPGDVQPLHRVITHLNDEHRWTREQIAYFVQRIEEPKTLDAEDPPVAEAEEALTWP